MCCFAVFYILYHPLYFCSCYTIFSRNNFIQNVYNFIPNEITRRIKLYIIFVFVLSCSKMELIHFAVRFIKDIE